MRKTGTEQGKSTRLLRIGEQIRHILAQILGRHEVRDPVLDKLHQLHRHGAEGTVERTIQHHHQIAFLLCADQFSAEHAGIKLLKGAAGNCSRRR